MKQFTTIVFMLIGMISMAQTKGNGTVITKEFDIETINKFALNMYANVTLDASLESKVIIQVESNLLDKIDFEVVDGKLDLQQLEWISATKSINITIGTPRLEFVEVGSHETVIVKNLNQKSIALSALIGKIEATGNVVEVSVNAENGFLDLSNLEAKKARLNIWGDGKAMLNVSDSVEGEVSKDGKIEFEKMPKMLSRKLQRQLENYDQSYFDEAKYITFKIKNNSWNRNNFVVKGPKADGSFFGYGFPMMPGAVKKERWTVGTKIYKVNTLGLRKLVYKIKAEDEGTTIKLFQS